MSNRTAQERSTGRQGGIVAVLGELTDAMAVLFRQHLQLVRFELKEDARAVARNLAVAVVFGAFALFGYFMLNGAAVLFAGWGFGIHGMAITALLLAVINLGFGLRAVQMTMVRLRSDGIALDRTAHEIEKDIEWVKEIREK